MRKFDITVEGHYPSRSDYHYHDNGEFVRAEIAEDMYEALDQLSGAIIKLTDPDQPNPTGIQLCDLARDAENTLAKARGEQI